MLCSKFTVGVRKDEISIAWPTSIDTEQIDIQTCSLRYYSGLRACEIRASECTREESHACASTGYPNWYRTILYCISAAYLGNLVFFVDLWNMAPAFVEVRFTTFFRSRSFPGIVCAMESCNAVLHFGLAFAACEQPFIVRHDSERFVNKFIPVHASVSWNLVDATWMHRQERTDFHRTEIPSYKSLPND